VSRADPRLVALVAVAALSILPPLLATLDVSTATEVVDHVVPGVIAVMAAGYALAAPRESAGSLTALGICAVTGLWETATHLTLVLDAGSPGRPAGAVALHALPGAALLGLSLWLLLAPPR
jgi:hypothetical protein